MKLTLEHLCAYLPHDVDIEYTYLGEGRGAVKRQVKLNAHMIDHRVRGVGYDDMKLILRHPSCLTKEIEHRGEKFVPSVRLWNAAALGEVEIGCIMSGEIYHHEMKKLHSWMIDTYGLIEAGLAIDVETLTENPYAK